MKEVFAKPCETQTCGTCGTRFAKNEKHHETLIAKIAEVGKIEKHSETMIQNH